MGIKTEVREAKRVILSTLELGDIGVDETGDVYLAMPCSLSNNKKHFVRFIEGEGRDKVNSENTWVRRLAPGDQVIITVVEK